MSRLCCQSCTGLLDVELGCVKDASLDDRYISLSYVSPASNMSSLRLIKERLKNVYTEGFLDNIRSSLPRTISDAIGFVKALVEKHLWVDALCVAHDEEYEMSRCGRLMSSVYRQSYFTLVAASGPDANSGLAGPTDGVAHN